MHSYEAASILIQIDIEILTQESRRYPDPRAALVCKTRQRYHQELVDCFSEGNMYPRAALILSACRLLWATERSCACALASAWGVDEIDLMSIG